jgi:hypothetical protein
MRRPAIAAASLSLALLIPVPAIAARHGKKHQVHITTKEAAIK